MIPGSDGPASSADRRATLGRRKRERYPMTVSQLLREGGSIEPTPDAGRPGRPSLEAFAPPGFCFNGDLTSMVCFGQRDLRERLRTCELEPLPAGGV